MVGASRFGAQLLRVELDLQQVALHSREALGILQALPDEQSALLCHETSVGGGGNPPEGASHTVHSAVTPREES